MTGVLPEQPALWKQLLACASFCIFNIGLCEFNSWALQKDRWPGFHFTWFYTMFHMLVSAIAAFLLQWSVTKPAMGGPTFQQAWEYRLLIIPMGLCSYLMNGLNNASLALVTLFLNQAIKVTLPFFTMSFSFLFANKTYSAMMIFVVFGLCVGSVLSVWHKMSAEGGSSSIMGVFMCIIGMMAGAIKGVLVMILCAGVGPMADKPKLEPTVVLVYDCSIAFVLMLITWACLDEREQSIAYLSDPDTRAIGLIIIAIGSSMAFCFNLSMFYFTMLTTALTATVGSSGVKVLLIVVSAVQAGVNDPVSWFGVATVVVTLCAYSYLTLHEKPKPLPADTGGIEAATTAGAKTEQTPLIKP
ncbi:solute carrier family 35 member c2 [Chrysochromulina tobinii]|uniref:Solute carrier family 35 member c2 n=1 Tax=Chrysochromulina tobinii TaxID=1460289 RepID=A0A0M0LPX4_9EUKA|nr:solute carrier family 35 member c2 [Chrysochromulina tobinii]|eukprot:KOO53115.1 solute carrier family 35 member c2 [Chrysochromulina sp. CCMP291]